MRLLLLLLLLPVVIVACLVLTLAIPFPDPFSVAWSKERNVIAATGTGRSDGGTSSLCPLAFAILLQFWSTCTLAPAGGSAHAGVVYCLTSPANGKMGTQAE